MVEFRTKFHNMIVHDLRAPSNSIQMSAEQALLSIKNMKRQCFKQGFDSFLKQYKHSNQQNIPPIKKRRAPVRKQSSCKNIFIDDENEHDVIRVKEIQFKNFSEKRIFEKKSFKNNFFKQKLVEKLSIIKSDESSTIARAVAEKSRSSHDEDGSTSTCTSELQTPLKRARTRPIAADEDAAMSSK